MNNQDKYVISPLEMSISLIAFIIGVGVLTIPGTLADTLDTADGWITIIVSGFMVMVLVFLFVHLQKHFPGQTFLEYLRQGAVGKWWAFIFAVLFIVYFVTLLGFEVRVLSIVTGLYLIDRTPTVVIVSSILLVTSYAVSKGVSGIIHLNVLFTPIILLVLLGVLSFNVDHFELGPLLPLVPKGVFHMFKAVPDVALAFVGIEILFFFMAHMKADKLYALPLNIGIGVIMLSYVFVTLITYTVFSVDESKVIAFTTVELAKAIEIPGGFFERIESMMITVWTMSIFNTAAMSQLLAVHILEDQFFSQISPTNRPPKKSKWLAAVIVFFAIIFAFIPESVTETMQFGDWIGMLGMGLFLCGIVVGYFTVWWRKKDSIHT
ncbi:GerAB/ArcD/ProY family transporter [Evansella halocellulosilytica]|uniref:GerAB/ArcD/ProY family transporter n=1 Tax=Evansella halocellulosilytica TaxID=2011013 RepID=UPI000BB8C969|nr:GerAB/ArcD/ProY family transporter [Evansella halocellulosilytica]